MGTKELKKLFNSETEFLEYKGLIFSIKDNNEEIKRLEKELNYHLISRYNRKMQLQEICPHIDTKVTKDYEEGGYLETGKYVTTITCKICDKVLDIDIKSTGSYA